MGNAIWRAQRRAVRDVTMAGLCVILSALPWPAGAQDPRAGQPETPARRVEPSPSNSGPRSPTTRLNRRIQDIPLESDNLTFRPTVLVRRGNSQGSGTIIASLEDDTLILTASHVVRGNGPIHVELHRYNLGLERSSHGAGNWPRQVTADAVATDTAADLAILRIRNMVALPYVARMAGDEDEPTTSATLTSLGIDLGAKLASWKTRLVEVLWFELNDAGNDRPFLVTAKIPEHGRSGGGLFDKDGQLVGVCVGHAELVKGRRMGVFSSIESARRMLEKHELTAVIDRSEARRDRLARSPISGRPATRTPRSAVTPTEATGATGPPG
jgi:S1-C subfamily serine protease